MMSASRLRIIVLGYIVRGPLGGLAWHHLQYVLGLARLGHDVYFVEDSDDYPACYDPVRNTCDVDPSYGLRFAASAFDRLHLPDRWAYFDAHQSRWRGPAASRVLEVCRTADLLLNVSMVNPIRPWLADVPSRAAIDTDPVFTQIRHLTDEKARALARQHTIHFSFGENIAAGTAATPQDGFEWRPTRQPVVLDAWPLTPGPPAAPFTSVMVWHSYPAAEYDGRHYGMKSASFEAFLDLPRRAAAPFELALGTRGAPRDRIIGAGWTIVDPREPTRDPWTYQQYIRQSRAEFGIAKHGYVVTRSGWFSERSAAYLASGRPVVVQDTGFSEWLSCDGGVLPFGTLEQAIEGIRAINSDYQFHCRRARMVAEEYFDANRVLVPLIEAAANRQDRS